MAEAAVDEVEALWVRWRSQRAPADRADLCSAYAGFVKMLAAKCYSHRVSQGLEFSDYLQFGMVGLLEAIDRYNPEYGVKFETFAGHRVQGAILNGVENLCEVQKQVAVRRRVIRERAQSVSESHGAGEDESALERLAKVAIGLALGFALEGTGMYMLSEVAAPDNAYARLETRQLSEQLERLVRLLPGQEQTVIRRHYFQQVPFDQIAISMSLTKGRISQIHKSALSRLRTMREQHAGFETFI